jgi:hypothetical protein
MNRPKRYKALYCSGPLCNPIYLDPNKGTSPVDSFVCALKIREGEDITKYGWEYRHIDGKRVAVCERCLKVLNK